MCLKSFSSTVKLIFSLTNFGILIILTVLYSNVRLVTLLY